MKTNWTGLIAAPHTPFAADGSLNLGVIEKQCEKLIDDGVTGAFICGSTGEGVSLSTAERQAVA
jgi:N-acetylneuraminate lyase